MEGWEKRRSESSEIKRTRFARERNHRGFLRVVRKKIQRREESTTRWNKGGTLPLFFFLLPYVYLHREFPEKHKGFGKLDSFFSRSGGTKGRATNRLRRTYSNSTLLSELWWILQGSDYDNISRWYFFIICKGMKITRRSNFLRL